jgi:hypothetical protein
VPGLSLACLNSTKHRLAPQRTVPVPPCSFSSAGWLQSHQPGSGAVAVVSPALRSPYCMRLDSAYVPPIKPFGAAFARAIGLPMGCARCSKLVGFLVFVVPYCREEFPLQISKSVAGPTRRWHRPLRAEGGPCTSQAGCQHHKTEFQRWHLCVHSSFTEFKAQPRCSRLGGWQEPKPAPRQLAARRPSFYLGVACGL